MVFVKGVCAEEGVGNAVACPVPIRETLLKDQVLVWLT